MTATWLETDEHPERAQEGTHHVGRGKLKVFFGAAPGVGTTYAMLQAAREEVDEGKDVLLGLLEHHGQRDTVALLLGMEVLARRKAEHDGRIVEEFDLDSALARRPALIVVDELAHTNAEGSRHARRWQDVAELLDAGIDVYTTLNVQHVESLNDIVAQIIGVRIRETVPDAILERTDEIRTVDLSPDDLIDRLREGKVHVPAGWTIESSFTRGNLTALRDLALRTAAERVDRQVETYQRAEGIRNTWSVPERLLACVSPSALCRRSLRTAKRTATALRAPLIAVYVETPLARLSAEDGKNLARNLALAQSLGAEIVRLIGPRRSEEILRYARSRSVTRIFVGKPTHPPWRDILRGSFIEGVIRASGDIIVVVVSGDAEDDGAVAPSGSVTLTSGEKPRVSPGPYVLATVIVAVATIVAIVARPHIELADLVMVYLVGIIVVSMRVGYGPSLFAALLSVASLDFFCVPPILSFAVSDLQHIITFVVMLLVAAVMTTLADRVRRHAVVATERERRTAALYAASRELAGTRGRSRLASVAAQHMARVFDASVVIFLPADADRLAVVGKSEARHPVDDGELGVAQWAYTHARPAGLGTDTLPAARALYLPLAASRGAVGVVGVAPAPGERFLREERELLDAFVNQAAVAIERAALAEEAERARLQAESERLRNTLFSSISHDLRTPLAAISGAAGVLREDRATFSAMQRELVDTIDAEADRLGRLLANLLEMARLESGSLQLRREWQSIEEVIGSALHRLEKKLAGRTVTADVPPDMPLVELDAALMEQAFLNLLENALKYTPAGSPIDVTARRHGDRAMVVEIADRGAGITPGEEELIFEKFRRADSSGVPGFGLGLTICRGLVEAHGGHVGAQNRSGGGAVFRVELPITRSPPDVRESEDDLAETD